MRHIFRVFFPAQHISGHMFLALKVSALGLYARSNKICCLFSDFMSQNHPDMVTVCVCYDDQVHSHFAICHIIRWLCQLQLESSKYRNTFSINSNPHRKYTFHCTLSRSFARNSCGNKLTLSMKYQFVDV